MIRMTHDNWRHGTLQLLSWPELAHAQADQIPHLARICALLARRPSTCVLISLRLSISLHTATGLLEQLQAQGHIGLLENQVAESGDIAPDETQTGNDLADPAPRSFLGRLWHQLTARKQV